MFDLYTCIQISNEDNKTENSCQNLDFDRNWTCLLKSTVHLGHFLNTMYDMRVFWLNRRKKHSDFITCVNWHLGIS